MIEDNNIKETIDKKIMIAEGNIIGCLWKDPSFYELYELNKQELSDDGLFYYGLGEMLFKLGHKVFDEVAVLSVLEGNNDVKEKWNSYGGYKSVKELINASNTDNINAYLANLDKYLVLRKLVNLGYDVSKEWGKFEQMTAEEIVDYQQYKLLNIGLSTSTNSTPIEHMWYTDEELESINKGKYVGLNYGKACPQLNYLTLGIPKGDLTMFGSYVNGGKSSFVTANIVIPIAESGVKVHIISNEQRSETYKNLFLIHVINKYMGDKGYANGKKINRKSIKAGSWTEEEKAIINEANKLIEEKFPNVTFTKIYEYDMKKVCNIIKAQSKLGVELFVYDTMKGDNLTDGKVWESLIENSKMLFQTAAKEDVGVVVTFQLALHTLQKRFLDLSVLSNAKQVSEVFSEIILFRDMFSDEYTGEKADIHCYKLKKDMITGKYLKDTNNKSIKEEITLSEMDDTKYKIFFLAKTRNDEKDVCLLYKFDGAWNSWKELGRCNVKNIGQ